MSNPQNDPKHIALMSRAIELAARGLYTTAPNPRVGCLIVKNGKILGEGWHIRAGEGHAEINALQKAGTSAKAATAYVTLEPCSHTGKTPPCAEALIAAGVSEVVIAMQDPNPQVSGAGIQKLRDAGIHTIEGVLADEAAALNPGFVKRMRHGLPWVCCKMAMSIDARTAMASGESQWITGPAARREVQRLRARSCAILTGIGSILEDDSALTVRIAEMGLEADAMTDIQPIRQPLRVVLDSALRIPEHARILRQPGQTLVVTSAANTIDRAVTGAEQIAMPASAAGSVDLPALMAYLAARECNEVLLEAGATLAGAMLQAQLIDEIRLYVAPKLLGNQARGLFALPFEKMFEQMALTIKDIRAVGDDWCMEIKPEYGAKISEGVDACLPV